MSDTTYYKRNKETILNRANVYCKKKTKKN